LVGGGGGLDVVGVQVFLVVVSSGRLQIYFSVLQLLIVFLGVEEFKVRMGEDIHS